jgi:3-oxoacyl-[acyl-carrier-protein] synthase II
MIAGPTSALPENQRIVITGIGLTAPNGNSLQEYRESLLAGRSGVSKYEIRYVGETLAGVCNYEVQRYQSRKDARRGTRAGSIGIYAANEAVRDSGLDWENVDRARVGVYIGVTEHGNVETENEIYALQGYDYDTSFWSHHHNPRTVANNPAGEVALNLGIVGPHYTIGAACAAGNAGLIQGAQMLRLGDCDVALAGGVSESIHTFGIFASFKSQGALAAHDDPVKASRPFDVERNGIVVAEGGCMYVLERLDDAKARRAKIFGELVGYAINTDATDFVLPNPERQAQCIELALRRAGLAAEQIDIVSTHATGTASGDTQECAALRQVFGRSQRTRHNNTKSFIGHAMGAAGALELAGNLPAFEDGVAHATINVDQLDPECALEGLVLNQPRESGPVTYILNNSFGMLGINSAVIIKKL